MKLTAIIAIMLTGIGFLVLAFGGEFWSAPFAILAIILFIAAGKEQKRRETHFVKSVHDLPNWESQWQERLAAKLPCGPEAKNKPVPDGSAKAASGKICADQRAAGTNHPTADPVPPEHNSKSRLANGASGKSPFALALVTPGAPRATDEELNKKFPPKPWPVDEVLECDRRKP